MLGISSLDKAGTIVSQDKYAKKKNPASKDLDGNHDRSCTNDSLLPVHASGAVHPVLRGQPQSRDSQGLARWGVARSSGTTWTRWDMSPIVSQWSSDNDEEFYVEVSVDLNHEMIKYVGCKMNKAIITQKTLRFKSIPFFLVDLSPDVKENSVDAAKCTTSPRKKPMFRTPDSLECTFDAESELAIPLTNTDRISFGWSPQDVSNVYNVFMSDAVVNSTCLEIQDENNSLSTSSNFHSTSNVEESEVFFFPQDTQENYLSMSKSVNSTIPVVKDQTESKKFPEPTRKVARRRLQPLTQDVKQFRDIGIQCERPMFSYEQCKRRGDKDLLFYTGLTPDGFEILYNFLGGDKECESLKSTPKTTRESKFTPRDKLFMTLLRLRRGFPEKDMEIMFDHADMYLGRICYTWMRKLSLDFNTLQKSIFVSANNQRKNPPDCYAPFPNVRCVIDCTEFKVQIPDNLEQASNMFSAYKGAETVKVLIATSVYGGLCFVSEAADGSISDRKLLLKSGLLDLLKPGDAIMADKGFDIEADLNERGIDWLIPSFLGNRKQFSQKELMLNKAIATARVHVERFIKYVKDFRLVRDPFIQWDHNADKDKAGGGALDRS
ncbi:LOW QUALITY PROTEIN: putative pectinesterase/pectinesterase inhibitor 60 [Frankliniella fusca]|uniref:Pectinesterase/pectinesterase inhibitor 60 n=1 Tax=Frankliniella fusca TaxID=407009 RepID=A0AAE1HQA9_9NEOP|nr:LOW QUALITY PROTEIN: putative pectinesterase/pectinesterase inhibitor 60 [Frankliniella fusca]